MKDLKTEKIFEENKKLREENKKLKQDLKELSDKYNHLKENLEFYNLLNPINKHNQESTDFNYFNEKFLQEKLKDLENNFNDNPKASFNARFDENINDNSKNVDDMSIVSFLARSNKRVEILKSLDQGDKIPSAISKEIGDSSHHVSKYLSSLKEKELVICLNDEDKRFRFYSITAKGKYYLEIIQNNQY